MTVRIVKLLGLALLVLLIATIILPALVVRGCDWALGPQLPSADPYLLNVYDHRREELVQMPLGYYLAGVVAAEMPAEFHIQALKAQAVVARTYTVNKLRQYGGSGCERHPEADICTDFTHCQAWISREEAWNKWPLFRQTGYWQKIVQAVTETEGEILTYMGKPIDAVFHSTCGGATENSEDVWSNPFSYLRGVSCGYCIHSPRITETITMTSQEVAERLGVSPEELKLEVVSRTESGRIIQIDVGGRVMRGLEFRQSLGLRSSLVTWLREPGRYTFTTTGYGHGVGMCQYGADGMADKGRDYIQILRHYYTGVELQVVGLGE